jgi:multidrug efflux system membrane fusion protein
VIQQQLRKGRKLSVDAFDRTESAKLASGELLTLDNVIDPTTGTLKLKAIFENKDSSLFPSQFVNARLLVDTQRNVTLIPTPAIQRNAQGAYVYVIKSDQTASMRTITPGTTDGSVTAVQGVEPQEVVAVNGFDKLLDNAKVSVRQSAGASGSGQERGQGQPSQTGHNNETPAAPSAAPSSKKGGSQQ